MLFWCSSTCHLFTSRLRLVYWSTLKIANDLPIFASYYAFVIVSLTWLAYSLTHSVFHLFSVSLRRRANARNVKLYYPYWQYTNLFLSLHFTSLHFTSLHFTSLHFRMIVARFLLCMPMQIYWMHPNSEWERNNTK